MTSPKVSSASPIIPPALSISSAFSTSHLSCPSSKVVHLESVSSLSIYHLNLYTTQTLHSPIPFPFHTCSFYCFQFNPFPGSSPPLFLLRIKYSSGMTLFSTQYSFPPNTLFHPILFSTQKINTRLSYNSYLGLILFNNVAGSKNMQRVLLDHNLRVCP